MKKRILSLILGLSFVFSFSTIVFGETEGFYDVTKDHWAYNDIMSGVEKGFFGGYPDGTFKPDGNVTRAETIKVLTSFLGRTIAKPNESIYTDLDVNAWYAPYVNVSNFMIPEKWKDEKLFKADTPVTREEVIYSLIVALQYDYKIGDADLSLLRGFSDKEKIGFGLESYMALALEFGILSGNSDNTIKPDANITRAEFATLMARAAANKAITDARREQVLNYMTNEMTLLWTSDEDFTYALDSSGIAPEQLPDSVKKIEIKKGNVYRGVPYSYAAGDINSFLDYSYEKDENGVYKLSGLTWQDFSTEGGSVVRTARLGNDCGASIQLAYGSIGLKMSSIGGVTKLTPNHGYPRVGKYKAPEDYNFMMTEQCAENGEEVMYEAYTQLQPGDVVLKVDRNWSSHVRMVKEVKVVYDENGKIDPEKSIVIAHDQIKDHVMKTEKYFDEKLGKDVYVIGGYNIEYTFKKLFKGWCPTTIEGLINPAPIEEAKVTDSLTEHNIDNIFEGKITSNWIISNAKIEIKDKEGKVVQYASILPVRNPEIAYGDSYKIDMNRFKTAEDGLIEGKIDTSLLKAGDYHCTLTIRLVSGEEFVVRDYDFKI